MMDSDNHINLFIVNNLAERVGFENTSKRSINNMQSTGGAHKAYGAVVIQLSGL